MNKSVLQQLQKELSKGSAVDTSAILLLSHELASLDDSKARFSVDAGLIDRLGKELVSKQETAVSELVKNAYDADATTVQLVFIDTDTQGGTLKIIDNGLGMTKDELVNGFMRLASPNKVINPYSKKYGRKKAGEKGIGRFSTQRLGAKLTVITKSEEITDDVSLKLEIFWDAYKQQQNLFLIEHDITEIEHEWENGSGTVLIIDNLRDAWSEATIKRAYRFTSELIQPFPLTKITIADKKDENKELDLGFQSIYYKNSITDKNIIVDDENQIFEHALAEISGYVEDDGQGYWTLKSDKLDFAEDLDLIGNSDNKDDKTTPFNLIEGLEFKVYYFLFDPLLMPKGKLNFIRTLAHKEGGIRLYRNGFRVLPYGEQSDDWLGLDKSTTRQMILSSHRNFNFFGFVQLIDDDNKFQETASREGLIENDAYNELTNFVYKCILSAVQKVAHLRGRKATASQKDFVPIPKKDPIENLEDILDDIDDEETPSADFLKEKLGLIKDAVADEKSRKQELIAENNMLRVLAGLGLVIGEFVHEIKRFLPSFNNEIYFLSKELAHNSNALTHLDALEEHLNSFRTYTSFFDNAVSRNTLRELENIELRDAVRSFERAIENDLQKQKIDFQTSFKGYELFTIPMHPSEWASILFNLYSNAKKAMQRAKVTDKKIKILCGRKDGNVFLEFSDNGDGISESNEEFIFDAFFTTSSAIDKDDDINALTSTGLGLKIVHDIIESYKGQISLISSDEGFSTTFRIEIPKGEEEDE